MHVEVRRVAAATEHKAAVSDEVISQRVHALVATLPIIEDGAVDFSACAVSGQRKD